MTRRPSLPLGARGLLAALAAERRGDAYPLLLWHGGPRGFLQATLADWCGDPDLADATVACVVSSAWRAGVSGVGISDELPWMSGTAAHHLAELARARSRALGLAMRFASGTSEAAGPSKAETEVERRRAHVRVVAAITLLPPPYAHAMTLRHVQGLQEHQVSRWLRTWNPITTHGARYILREGHSMLEVALMGRHPRKRWPRRYLENPRWSTTPPPPQRQL